MRRRTLSPRSRSCSAHRQRHVPASQGLTSRFVTIATSISDGITPMAAIGWGAATTALRSGELPCSGGERRILQLSASLAGGIPVDLRDAVTGLDDRNTALLITAIQRAAGRRT